jgi:GTPase SAR1 family protein
MYSNCKKGGPLLKVVVLGDMGVGKTCLMRRLVHDVFDFNSAHTIGVDFLTKEMTLNGDEFTLQVRKKYIQKIKRI